MLIMRFPNLNYIISNDFCQYLAIKRCGHTAHIIKSQELKTAIRENLDFYFSESSF